MLPALVDHSLVAKRVISGITLAIVAFMMGGGFKLP
ncbi:hypothetical protein GGR00_005109 [Aminobacter aganoensis]|uniref:Uncharacterized protein n=1 Tax=Aminobacter aganoensis TaxID=83264 RepID=A0A7X0FCN5_9HYPH|nr:hypothetical protein [Aminobacter aganoensis]